MIFSFCVAAGTAAGFACALFIAAKNRWQGVTKKMVAALQDPVDTDEIGKNTTCLTPSLVGLPPPVARHIQKALHLESSSSLVQPVIKSLHMEQEGSFLLDKKWITFEATQDFSASSDNPGFVWDSIMHLPLPLRLGSIVINVRDAYVGGQGSMTAKIMGIISIVDTKDTLALNEGELSRWLAELAVIPTAFIPSHDSEFALEWKKWDSTKDANLATAILTDKRRTNEQCVQTEVEFRFDNMTGLISSIFAMRPYCPPGSKEISVLPWQGHFSEYVERQGILVPTYGEVGWWKDTSTLELYFKGHNTKFEFQFI